MASNINSENGMHPELNSLNQELKLIDLAVSNHARPYGYIKAGEALNRVQEQQLFKHLYNSFDEFCFNRYKFQGEQGYKLIRASDVAKLLKNEGFSILPENESHARCFTKLLRHNQTDIIIAIWLELTSSGETITAKRIKDFIYKYSKSSSSSSFSTNPPSWEVSPSNRISIDLQGELEKNHPLSQVSEPPIHQSKPIYQLPEPNHQRNEESQLVEKLTEQLAEEGRKNRELADICWCLTDNLNQAIIIANNATEATQKIYLDKDLEIQELKNQVQSLRENSNQWMNYANQLREQANLDSAN